jgi:hypothetical protein
MAQYQKLLDALGRLNHDLAHVDDDLPKLFKAIEFGRTLEKLYALELPSELLVDALNAAREGCALCEARDAEADRPQPAVRKNGPPYYRVLGTPLKRP